MGDFPTGLSREVVGDICIPNLLTHERETLLRGSTSQCTG